MRVYRVFGLRDGVEELVATVSSPAQGKAKHQEMKREGFYEYIRVRDALGGLRFEYNLQTGRKTA